MMQELVSIAGEGFLSAVSNQSSRYFNGVASIFKQNIEAKYDCEVEVLVKYTSLNTRFTVNVTFLKGIENIPDDFCKDWEGNTCIFDGGLIKFNITGESK
jgi:hypothetical protein